MSNLVEVKIPTNANPFTVTVNGKPYSYPAGATVQVPYEVAEVINQISRGPNLPPSSGGGSGGGGADLLDEEGIIKQKHLPEGYPYSEMGIGTILEESSYSVDAESMRVILPTVTLLLNETYTVNWNGTEYACVCVAYTDGDMVGSVLGNLGFVTGGEDTKEPFLIVAVPGHPAGALVFDGSETVRLSITGGIELITPIEEKYLGNAKPFVVVFEGSMDASTGTYYPDKASKSYSEVKAAVNNCRPIFAYAKTHFGGKTTIAGLVYSTTGNVGTDDERLAFAYPAEDNYYDDTNELRLNFSSIVYRADGTFNVIRAIYDISATKV